MPKPTYQELLRRVKLLESKLDEFEFAGKRAFVENYERYISIPLTGKQVAAAKEHYEEHLAYDDYTKVTLPDGSFEKAYSEVHDSIFAEYPKVLVKYITDPEGNHTSGLQIWGLIPV